MFDEGLCIHTLLSARRGERNYSIRIRRIQQTHRLFLDTKRSIRNIRIFHSFEFVRVRCRTKNASLIYLPGDYDDLVSFNRIEYKRASLKDALRNKSTVWLAVMNKFHHEKRDFDIGDILKVTRPWLGRRLLNWIKNQTIEGRIKYLNTYVHPRKKCVRIPVDDLQTHCRGCDSPTQKKYKSLSDAIETETFPFLMTVPFDPFSRSVRRTSKYKDSKDESNTTYFEKVVIDGIERFTVLLTSLSDEQDRISAVVVPEEVQFNAECNMNSDTINDGCHINLSEQELTQIRQRLEPLLMKMDTVDDLTQIDLESQTREHARGDSDVEHQVEMQCLVKYKASFKSTYTSSPIVQPVAKNHPYYNVVVGATDQMETAEEGCGPEKEEWGVETEEDEEDTELISFDEKGGFIITKGGKTNNNDYLSPLNTRNYTRFKSTIQKIQDEEIDRPDTMVFGVKGYVQVSGDEEKKRETKPEVRYKKKKVFKLFNRKKLEETTTTSPSILSTEKLLDDYQPMFDIHQEKPPLPPKPASLSMSSKSTSMSLGSSLGKSPASPTSMIGRQSTPNKHTPTKRHLVRQWTACKEDEEQSFKRDSPVSSLLPNLNINELPDRFEFLTDSDVSSPVQQHTFQRPHVLVHQRKSSPDKRSSTAPLLFDESSSDESPIRRLTSKKQESGSLKQKPSMDDSQRVVSRKKPELPRKPLLNKNRSSMKPLLDSFDNEEEDNEEEEEEDSDFPQSPKSDDSFENNSSNRARRNCGKRTSTHSVVLDSRIHYFESKFIQ